MILLAAAAWKAPLPPIEASSARSATRFSECFTRAQDAKGRAWGYMPSGEGGTFTDSGAHGAPASYWLQVRSLGKATQLRLYAADGAAPAALAAVEQCR